MPEVFNTSGLFPATASSATPRTSASASTTTPLTSNTTTTGAMMEFLGGNVGHSLSFRGDRASSPLTVPDTAACATEELAWPLPDADADAAMGTASEDDALLAQLDALIRAATSTAGEPHPMPTVLAPADAGPASAPSPSKMDLSWVAAGEEAGLDTAMQDFDFDDLTFDGVFDMPLDESFGPFGDGAE